MLTMKIYFLPLDKIVKRMIAIIAKKMRISYKNVNSEMRKSTVLRQLGVERPSTKKEAKDPNRSYSITMNFKREFFKLLKSKSSEIDGKSEKRGIEVVFLYIGSIICK